jgi:hypothetical protein
MGSSSHSFAGFRPGEFHGQPTVPLALTPEVQTEIGQRDHDLITLIDQEAGDEEHHAGAGGQGLNQLKERAAV